LSAGSTPACATQFSSVGWASASPSGRNPPATRCAGSTPARRTSSARSSIGRTAAPQAAKAGSIPARATMDRQPDQVMEQVDMRRSERRAHCGVGVRLSPWSPLMQAGRCPAGPHKAGPSGSIPGPATWRAMGQVRQHGRVRKLVTRRGREPRDFVSSTLTPVTIDPVVQRRRRLGDNQESDGSTPSGIILQSVCRCFGRHTSLVRGRPGSNPGRTSATNNGLLVQREDTWSATRRSGFDSPAVH
jgi:hypothetical protein